MKWMKSKKSKKSMKSMKSTKLLDRNIGRKLKKTGIILLVGTTAVGLWLWSVPYLFSVASAQELNSSGVSLRASAMAKRHMNVWRQPVNKRGELRQLRTENPEWDFMARTFWVMSLANMALREPNRQNEYVLMMDKVIDDTLRKERSKGMYYFLMNYAKRGEFKQDPARSQFIDGEIAFMLGARRMVQENTRYRDLMRDRLHAIHVRMARSPSLNAESYPNECWTFCNAIAIAAMKMGDVLDGETYTAFIQQWITHMKRHLTDAKSGLLVSSFRLDGTVLDGPEGSSLWMVLHCLSILDESFAAEQYQIAKEALIRDTLGYAYAKEWADTAEGRQDVDSGPIIPGLDASPGSSGLAILGAATFSDNALMKKLLRSLDTFALPEKNNGTLRFNAGNLVGDAVILYALVQGPLFKRVRNMD